MVTKIIIRFIGCLSAGGVIFLALMPFLGFVTDWNTISSSERMLGLLMSGICVGIGLVLLAFFSGLLAWIFQKFES